MADRPVLAAGGPIAADDAPWWLGSWQSNGDLIAEVARLGYLDGRVLDATYGRGTFWKVWQGCDLWTNDLNPASPAQYRHDYRSFPPEWGGTFDAVVFDPDYKLNGTPALGDFDERYGIGGDVKREERMQSIVDGALECWRATRRYLLVKCMDQVESGRQWWQGDIITNALCRERAPESTDVPATKIEEFYFLGGGRPQPADRTRKCPTCNGDGVEPEPNGRLANCRECHGTKRVASRQVHAYARPSKLLIFQKG